MHVRFAHELEQPWQASRRLDPGICGILWRLSHEAFRQGCHTCHCGVSRSSACMSSKCREIRFFWSGLRRSVHIGNGGTTPGVPLDFPVESASSEMRQESRESFPDEAGKGTLISSYEEETGLLLMWAGPSGFLSSGGGYVGELLELQQGCEGPFGSSRGKV